MINDNQKALLERKKIDEIILKFENRLNQLEQSNNIIKKTTTKKKQTRSRYVHWCTKSNRSVTIYGKPNLRTDNLKGKVTEDEILHLIIRSALIWSTRNDMCKLMEELELDIGLLE